MLKHNSFFVLEVAKPQTLKNCDFSSNTAGYYYKETEFYAFFSDKQFLSALNHWLGKLIAIYDSMSAFRASHSE